MKEANTEEVSSKQQAKIIVASVENKPTEFKRETKKVIYDVNGHSSNEEKALRKQTGGELKPPLKKPKSRERFITGGIIASILGVLFLFDAILTGLALLALGIFWIVKGIKLPKKTSDEYKQSRNEYEQQRNEYNQTEEYKQERTNKTVKIIVISLLVTGTIVALIILISSGASFSFD